MEKFTLYREDLVLLIIDIQEKLVPVIKYRSQVIRNATVLITAAQEMGFPVMVTEQYPQGLGRTVPELLGLIEEGNLFSKNSFTAYTDQVKSALHGLGGKRYSFAVWRPMSVYFKQSGICCRMDTRSMWPKML